MKTFNDFCENINNESTIQKWSERIVSHNDLNEFINDLFSRMSENEDEETKQKIKVFQEGIGDVGTWVGNKAANFMNAFSNVKTAYQQNRNPATQPTSSVFVQPPPLPSQPSTQNVVSLLTQIRQFAKNNRLEPQLDQSLKTIEGEFNKLNQGNTNVAKVSGPSFQPTETPEQKKQKVTARAQQLAQARGGNSTQQQMDQDWQAAEKELYPNG